MNLKKLTLNDVLTACLEFIFLMVRPVLFWVTWNYGICYKTNIPTLDFLQVISIIIIYYILHSYIPDPKITITTTTKENINTPQDAE